VNTPESYDLICSIGELVDKLSIENIKCYDSNMRAIAERRRESPSAETIADCELRARTAGEHRVRLRDELNRRLDEAIRRGGFDVAREVRTYS